VVEEVELCSLCPKELRESRTHVDGRRKIGQPRRGDRARFVRSSSHLFSLFVFVAGTLHRVFAVLLVAVWYT
jgi:hypothetical protein